MWVWISLLSFNIFNFIHFISFHSFIRPANCGKTLMLKPLEYIYHAFCKPANDKYVWVGADQTEVIFLQYFRWSPQLMRCKDLLLLLERELVKLLSLKNQFGSETKIKQSKIQGKSRLGMLESTNQGWKKDTSNGHEVKNIWILSQNSTGIFLFKKEKKCLI